MQIAKPLNVIRCNFAAGQKRERGAVEVLPGSRTAAGRASWQPASWRPGETAGTQTARPETHWSRGGGRGGGGRGSRHCE